jgi:hypothetical protein
MLADGTLWIYRSGSAIVCGMDLSPDKRRGKFQLHLSTCFVLFLFSSILIYCDIGLWKLEMPLEFWVGAAAFQAFGMFAVAVACEWWISSRKQPWIVPPPPRRKQ